MRSLQLVKAIEVQRWFPTCPEVPHDRLRFAFQIRADDCPLTVDECTLRGDADPTPVTLEVDGNTYDYDDQEERYCDPRHL